MPLFYRFVYISYILFLQKFIPFTNFQKSSILLNLYSRLCDSLIMVIHKLITRLHWITVKKGASFLNFIFLFLFLYALFII